MSDDGEDSDLPSVEAYTDPFLTTYTPPPAVEPGVCPYCRTATGTRYDGEPYSLCYSCRHTRAGVSQPLDLIVPISLYRVGKQLHTVLKDYKRSAHANVRERHLWQVGAILHRFVREHRSHIWAEAGRDWDTVTIVPSKAQRADAHPLESAILLGGPLREEYQKLLEPKNPETIDRNQSSDDGFQVTTDVAGKSVLLVDDTFTTGASLQSAASALSIAGADVVAGVVIGRVVDTGNAEQYPEKAELWKRQRAIPFSFDTCCLE
jgi:predicted amidophosphoribosyltransferase